jgi:multidrug efflux pump
MSDFPECGHVFMVAGRGPSGTAATSNTVFSGMVLTPWSERSRSQMELKQLLQRKIGPITGLKGVAINPAPLPGSGGGLPVQFVISSTRPALEIDQISKELLTRAMQSGLFIYADTDLKYDLPQTDIVIDRDKAADLGLTMEQIGKELAAMLGGNYINRFSIQGRSYKVIPLVKRNQRLNADQLTDYYIRTDSGKMIPLSTVVKLKQSVQPEQLKRFQQLNSAILSALPAPGVTMGEALNFLNQEATKIFPRGYQADYAGEARQFTQEGSALIITFFLAMIMIYLVLAAQFESFRDPLIILVSVPMSISGALIAITMGYATINIYTQVGLITLIGLISKHGILIVEFANDLQRSGLSKRKAIEAAAGIRLRPILMTTAATVMGVLPLVLATGAGAISRFNIGLVIATGMTIGTIFTLFVVPAIYLLMAKELTVRA